MPKHTQKTHNVLGRLWLSDEVHREQKQRKTVHSNRSIHLSSFALINAFPNSIRMHCLRARKYNDRGFVRSLFVSMSIFWRREEDEGHTGSLADTKQHTFDTCVYLLSISSSLFLFTASEITIASSSSSNHRKCIAPKNGTYISLRFAQRNRECC